MYFDKFESRYFLLLCWWSYELHQYDSHMMITHTLVVLVKYLFSDDCDNFDWLADVCQCITNIATADHNIALTMGNIPGVCNSKCVIIILYIQLLLYFLHTSTEMVHFRTSVHFLPRGKKTWAAKISTMSVSCVVKSVDCNGPTSPSFFDTRMVLFRNSGLKTDV